MLLWRPKGKRCFSIRISKGLTACKHQASQSLSTIAGGFHTLSTGEELVTFTLFSMCWKIPYIRLTLTTTIASALHSAPPLTFCTPLLNALGAVDTSLLASQRHGPFQLNCNTQQPRPWREIFEKTSCYNFLLISGKSLFYL